MTGHMLSCDHLKAIRRAIKIIKQKSLMRKGDKKTIKFLEEILSTAREEQNDECI